LLATVPLDGSTEYVEDWSRVNPAVKLVVLTRNFGHQYAVSAGLALTSGRYVGIMDADLQTNRRCCSTCINFSAVTN